MSNSFDPNQARHFVRPELGANCLEKLSAEDTSRKIVKVGMVFGKVNQDSSRRPIYDFIPYPCSAEESNMAHSLLFSSQFSY